MGLPESFCMLLLPFASEFTQPSYYLFQNLVRGWLLCPGRRSITNCIRTAQVIGDGHFSNYHRFFSQHVWSLDTLGFVLLGLFLRFLPPGARLQWIVDDTLNRKTGKSIIHAGMHRDPLLSTEKKDRFSFGLVFVIVCLAVFLPWEPKRVYACPLFFRLYRTKKTSQSQGVAHRKKGELATDIFTKIDAWLLAHHPQRAWEVMGDSEYVQRHFAVSLTRRLAQQRDELFHLPQPEEGDLAGEEVFFFGRLPLDAALYQILSAEEKKRRPGQMGAPRKKGLRLPNPQQVADDPQIPWKQTTVSIYGRQVSTQIKEGEALWYGNGESLEIHWLVVRDPKAKREDEAFFSTDLSFMAEPILVHYSWRWSQEVTHHDTKQFLRAEDPQTRNPTSTQRLTPFAFLLYSLVMLWAIQKGQQWWQTQCPTVPWYPQKKTLSFVDLLNLLKREALRETLLKTPQQHWTLQKLERLFLPYYTAVG